MSLRDTLLAKKDRKTVTFSVPAWDCEVTIQAFSGKVRDELDAEFLKRSDGGKVKNIEGLKAFAIVRSVVDGEGKLVFAPEDAPALQEKDAVALHTIWAEIEKLNLLGADSLEAAKKN
jgi:hypothetical protein